MKKIFGILFFTCLLLILLPQSGLPAFAATTYNVSDYNTLRNVVNNQASDGDTIVIQAPILVDTFLSIKKSLTLTATGTGKLVRGMTNGPIFQVYDGSITVTCENLTLDGNNFDGLCSAIVVYSGVLEFNNGTKLINCKNNYHGGGVKVSPNGKFIMNADSSITNASVTPTYNGGGVYVDQGIFIMNGGSITNNTADEGGGVYVNQGTFTMTGGSITDNLSRIRGGGVMLGSSCTVNLSGDVRIFNNHKSGDVDDNFYCQSASGTPSLTGTLASSAVIGVTADVTPTSSSPFTVAVGGAGYTISSDDAAKFASDNASYHTGYDSTNKKVLLGTLPVDVAISEEPQAVTYNGSAQAFAITGTPNTDFAITYNGSVDTPTNAGTYDVVITRPADIGYNIYSKTITGGLTINKNTPTIDTPPTAASITYGAALSTSVLSGGSPSVLGAFSWTNGSTIPTAGTNSYSVTFTPSDTVNYKTVTTDVTITVNPADVAINEAAQTFTYNGSPKAFAIIGTPSTGFTITYKQGSSTVTPTGAGTYDVEITREADTGYKAYSKVISGGLTINKVTPTINIPPIAANIIYGAELSTSVLSEGSASVQGTFSWTNGSTIPAVGTNSYSVTFTPSDTTNYNTATTTVAITVPTAPAIDAIPSQPTLYTGVDLNNTLTKPTVLDNGFLIQKQGWQSSADGNTGWQDVPVGSICTAGMNEYYMRYYVYYKPSGSGTLTMLYSPNTKQLTINRFTATLTLTVTPTSPQNSGTAVTLNAAISGSSLVLTSQGYLNTVPVTFKDGTTTLGTATITAASGTATLTTAALSIGNHTLTAEFPGESDYYAPATSNVVNYTIQVDPDIATVADAANNAANASYSNMPQAVATSETVITDALKATAATAVSNSDVTITINKIDYTAPSAGTSANPSGTSGSYTFTITVSKGSQSQTTVQMSITISATTYTGGSSGGGATGSNPAPVQSGTGKSEGTVVKDQQQSNGAPAASVNNSGAELKVSVLTPQEQKMVAQGENVRVILKVEDISASISAEEKQLIDETLNLTKSDTDTPALYVDLSLYKQVGDQEPTRITETNSKISISIEVPERLWNTEAGKSRTFYIIRLHENKAIRIDGTYDLVSHLFTFETDRFSAYALTYQDVNTTTVNNDGNTTDQPAQSQDFQHLRLTAKAELNTQTLTYVKVSGADGYLIYGAKCGQKLMKLKDVNKTVANYTVKNLKPATYYKYQVKAYKMINGKRVIIMSSKIVHSVTMSKIYANPTKLSSNTAAVKLSVGQTKTLTCQVVLPEGKKLKKHTAVICYESTNKTIATINSKGKIIAKAKGTCYVYAYAQNGVYKKVRVTVE